MSIEAETNAGASLFPHAHVVFTDLDGEGVLVDLTARTFYQLNETASLVWRGLTNGMTVVDIVRQMTEAYDVTTEQARSSVDMAVSRFVAHRWVSLPRTNG
ncbi:MAG: PqqD family protein [Acidobacteriota bacterium]